MIRVMVGVRVMVRVIVSDRIRDRVRVIVRVTVRVRQRSGSSTRAPSSTYCRESSTTDSQSEGSAAAVVTSPSH